MEKENSFNLLDEPWLPVLYNNGRAARVGVREALTQAGRIRQIAASNPMDRVAILRFLLALLYWCKGNPPDGADAALKDPFPADWFSKLDENEDCFNLLGNGKRFYQYRKTRSGNDKKLSANYLAQEVPTGTNKWHFRHSTDKINGLCRACCATGLLRLPLFATSGGQGKPPGINAKPPLYVVLFGSSLAETLRLSWVKVSNSEPGIPAWQKPDSQLPRTGAVPLLVGLTWLPRRVWLDIPTESMAACISCGRKERLIRLSVFAPIGSTQPITKANLKTFPVGIMIPAKLRKTIWYNESERLIILKGNLKEKEKGTLLKLSKDKQYQEAVIEIYRSQPHREWRDPHVVYEQNSKGDNTPIYASDALGASDAAADQWAKIVAGVLRKKGGNNKSGTWVVAFSTVKNDKYLEAMEYEIPAHCTASDQKVQEDIRKIEMWKDDKLKDRLRKIMRATRKPRKDDALVATAAMAAIRPHVESKVSANVGELLAGGDAAWEEAAREYRPMMERVARSLSPGFTVSAVQRRRQIANTLPNMRKLESNAVKKPGRKKGGGK